MIPALEEWSVESPSAPRQLILWPRQQDELKPPEWLIPGVVAKAGISAWWAREHSLKSFIVGSAAFSLSSAVDGDWGLGPHEPQRTLLLAAEGVTGTPLRRQAWELEFGVPASLFGLWGGDWLPEASSEDSIAAFIKAMREAPFSLALLVIDPWVSFLGTLKESDATECQQGVKMLRRIRTELGCAIAVVAHAGKQEDRGLRGSNALAAGVEHLHRIERRDPQGLVVGVINEHQKDARIVAPRWWRGKDVGPSLAFRAISEDEALAPGAARVSVGQILAILQRIGEPISTQVLAAELYQGPTDEEPSLTVAAVSDLRSHLDKAARKDPTLAPYVTGTARDRRWRAPTLQ